MHFNALETEGEREKKNEIILLSKLGEQSGATHQSKINPKNPRQIKFVESTCGKKMALNCIRQRLSRYTPSRVRQWILSVRSLLWCDKFNGGNIFHLTDCVYSCARLSDVGPGWIHVGCQNWLRHAGETEANPFRYQLYNWKIRRFPSVSRHFSVHPDCPPTSLLFNSFCFVSFFFCFRRTLLLWVFDTVCSSGSRNRLKLIYISSIGKCEWDCECECEGGRREREEEEREEKALLRWSRRKYDEKYANGNKHDSDKETTRHQTK